MADDLKLAKGESMDELANWAKMQQMAIDSSATSRPIEECLPDLAGRLHHTLQQALERASTGPSNAQSVQPEILWAPGRVTVRLGGDSYETATDDTVQSLEEALISAAFALNQALQEY
jgi:hypothetical protein